MWLCMWPPFFKQGMFCILCGLLALHWACPEMGQELFCSCVLLYNKTEAFRSALDQRLDLLVSSVMACDLISVIRAVKVIISGDWMCYPTIVPAAYPAGWEAFFFLAIYSYYAFVHMLGDTIHIAIVTLDLASWSFWYHTVGLGISF